MNKSVIPLKVRQHALVSAVRKAIGDCDVIVAISGGLDSTALLLLSCAAALQQSASFKVVAAHIHHGLREDSDEEQRHVESLCRNLGVKCITERIEVSPTDGSLAAGARESRYAALVDIATTHGIGQIAVAHHASDQLETMLMAMCRGSGLSRLAGMVPDRILSGDIRLIRPLLQVQKEELESICTSSNVLWCEDPTNQDTRTPRGRLRKDVIPILREIWPAAERHAANAAVLLQAVIDSYEKKIPNGTSWQRDELSSFPHDVIAQVVHRAVGTAASFETVQSIATAVQDDVTDPRSFTCADGCVATITAHQVDFLYT